MFTMSTSSSPCDVFLSHSTRDEGLARVIRDSFESAGLRVFWALDPEAGGPFSEASREAILEARAFVVLMTASAIHSQMMLYELGAAWGCDKPIFLLLDGITERELPTPYRSYPKSPMNELPAVVRHVARAAGPMSEQDKTALIHAYAEVGETADNLALHPATLAALASAFHATSSTRYSEYRLLQEIVRLRKQGKLPRRRSRARKAV